jgi:hypothetical protein
MSYELDSKYSNKKPVSRSKLWAEWLDNVGTLTSQNPIANHRMLGG